MMFRFPVIIQWLLIAAFVLSIISGVYLWFYSIEFNPRWLFSKYRKLRPYVIAQAKVESGKYSSRLYLEQNNAFGMRCAVVRESTAIACENNYSTYSNVGQSLADLFLWMDFNNFPTSVDSAEAYALALKSRGYFTASLAGYTTALKSHL